ncbi:MULTISPECIES: FadR/GntR family transcriptional regulator [Mycobacterium]|uniref:Transcriptional regulator, GntR family protein n=1 Tax=Mycobacterium indicus pranii (strain DSM 45239 / MTCC 9506) TaxID=1232724 RepID=J9WI13_MYCIP|nr:MULTISPECIES: FCD domain-containing protein [Mycobacterium]AFS15828.1 Transcriptional regulator, GntR family protein [Mycobacterium intracellulare subsp. intracellulare MTCC 9506]WSE52764.1 FCD domain-containing protein [Mycobacterium sp. 2-64]BCO53393.1 GntR family transcriptional regulator [Mycobacterium paraintracellulare]BCO90661.1 GntR family transcriptional regulator [Mycobacterium paraintracellulare]
MSEDLKAGHADKLASILARDIEADIVRRGWAVGESLGSELALQQRFGVSRSVLREAVRLVEHHQVARMRRGPNGGLYICEPDAGPATRAVVIYLEYLGTTLGDLLNARLVLEPLAASLAAERIDEAGIARLRAVLDAEEKWQPGLPAPRDEFHIALAEQSKNPVLQLFIDVLMRLTTRYALASRTDSATEAIEAVEHLHAHHSKIVAAVTAGDSARAKTLSERHVEAVTGWLQRHHPGDRVRGRTRRRRLDSEVPRGKLAEMLAVTIGDDIAASGWHVGSVFGTEAALLARYRVSRAVFREAVRLLEYHSIAHMRRGPGGGLVIAEPAAQASIDTIALYLQYRDPSREDLRCVRDAIEIDNVAKVVKRLDEPEVAAFLVAHRSRLPDAAQPTPDDVRRAIAEEFSFHVGLAQLAGNALLDLFLRIIVELFRRHWSSTGQALPTWSDVLAVHHAHLRIVEAVEAADESVACYRLRRHLDAAASWWL